MSGVVAEVPNTIDSVAEVPNTIELNNPTAKKSSKRSMSKLPASDLNKHVINKDTSSRSSPITEHKNTLMSGSPSSGTVTKEFTAGDGETITTTFKDGSFTVSASPEAVNAATGKTNGNGEMGGGKKSRRRRKGKGKKGKSMKKRGTRGKKAKK
jgi:hypothetical protein